MEEKQEEASKDEAGLFVPPPGRRSPTIVSRRRRHHDVKRSSSSPGGFKETTTSEEEDAAARHRTFIAQVVDGEAPRPTLRRAKAEKLRRAKERDASRENRKEDSSETTNESANEPNGSLNGSGAQVNKEINVAAKPCQEEAPIQFVADKTPVDAVDVNLKEETIVKKPVQESEKEEKGAWWKSFPSWPTRRRKSLECEKPGKDKSPPQTRHQSLNRRGELATEEELNQKEIEESQFWKSVMKLKKQSESDYGKAETESPTVQLAKKTDTPEEKPDRCKQDINNDEKNVAKDKISWGKVVSDVLKEWRQYKASSPDQMERMKRLWNRCMSNLIILIILCGLGAFVFRFTEGAFEKFYKCGVKRVKRDFINDLWKGSHYMKEEEWKSKARKKLMEFENQLQEAFEAGMTSYSGQKSWSFLNAVIYCLTVVTTIGYGHIAPATKTGRALTIVYAIFGIPMFLILLADFGKLFTRGIKFVWAFVRRLYYTGSCKKVRRTAPVQEVMKGVQLVYDMATFRRPSQFYSPEEAASGGVSMGSLGTVGFGPGQSPGDPPTPALSTYAIDDEFNLPISVAFTILLIYIFVGATIFYIWEGWSFFDSFYFVFISMSTIGFGDFVPQNQMYMMASIVYLMFGLALTSMCINVVQEKLSDTFRQASAKIGATIGLKVSDDDSTATPGSLKAPTELVQVHKSPSTAPAMSES